MHRWSGMRTWLNDERVALPEHAAGSLAYIFACLAVKTRAATSDDEPAPRDLVAQVTGAAPKMGSITASAARDAYIDCAKIALDLAERMGPADELCVVTLYGLHRARPRGGQCLAAAIGQALSLGLHRYDRGELISSSSVWYACRSARSLT